MCDFPNPAASRTRRIGSPPVTRRTLSLGTRHLLTAGAELEHETGALGNRSDDLLQPTRTNFGVYAAGPRAARHAART